MLEDFARRELASLVKPDDDGTQVTINRDIMELISTFAGQGHSGSTAHYAIGLFTRLAMWKPIGPLTGEPDEWTVVSEQNGKPLYQNKRRSSVFREGDDQAYDIDGRVFRNPDGSCWTSQPKSRVAVAFPYTVPDGPEIVDVPWEFPEPVEIHNVVSDEHGHLIFRQALGTSGFIVELLKPSHGRSQWVEPFGDYYEADEYFRRCVKNHGRAKRDVEQPKSLLREATSPDETKPPPAPGTRYKPEGFA